MTRPPANMAAIALGLAILVVGPLPAATAAKPPTRLWYTLGITYARDDTSHVERHAPGYTGVVDSEHKVRATFHPESAILLRRGPGRTFSVRVGRELTGSITLATTTTTETLPHCDPLREVITGEVPGDIAGSLGFEPADRASVNIHVAGNDTVNALSGKFSHRVSRDLWVCDQDALLREGLALPGLKWQGRLLSPPGVQPHIIGAPPFTSNPTGAAFSPLRSGLELFQPEFALRMKGAPFGSRHFTRTIDVTFRQPVGSATETGFSLYKETWKLTFSRCPQPRPCR
jgi:hypothetical protein